MHITSRLLNNLGRNEPPNIFNTQSFIGGGSIVWYNYSIVDWNGLHSIVGRRYCFDGCN